MSVEMRSQGSSDSEDEECDVDPDYYKEPDDLDYEHCEKADIEYFEFECLQVEDIERLLNECVGTVSENLKITPSLAKVLLYTHQWRTQQLQDMYKQDAKKVLIAARTMPENADHGSFRPMEMHTASKNMVCPVCLQLCSMDVLHGLSCSHLFCKDCWQMHFDVQIKQGVSTDIECMAKDCRLLVPEDFVLNHVSRTGLREKYQQYAFNDYVESHPELRFCPGPNCSIIVRAKEIRAKRVICQHCKTIFCFKCGTDYHAPTDCEIIKKWIIKCADDSETANYISAHTKDCPKCHICIEKNGGCNHMQCFKCKYDFCWMCLQDWKTHGSEYYECSRYKGNPNIANESAHAQAREALKKYLFYFERWENHAKSLKLEEETTKKIQTRIQEKILNNEGTWIDWQYLLQAAALLAKCRYTLQYTYPYAYYMETGSRKTLFEYQQAQLEAEIENLSWKVERAETTSRGDLENQMDVAEKRRTTLLRDFFLDFHR